MEKYQTELNGIESGAACFGMGNFGYIRFHLNKIIILVLVSLSCGVASDASGRYRGQFLFENDHWLGSMVACENLGRIDELELSFYVALTAISSPEPMIKVSAFELSSIQIVVHK